MREIKFRALSHNPSLKKDCWRYGGLTENKIGFSIREKTRGTYYGCFIKKTETIGQYTGEQDKDKNDIYEGDIIAVFHDQVIDGIILKEERGYKLYTVIYYKGMFCTSEDDDFPIGLWIHEKGADCQIMGNIFEDKELIK